MGWLSLATTAVYLIGFISAVDALFKSRQPQAKVAWILGLAFMPFFVVPLYWVFGRRTYPLYSEAMTEFEKLLPDATQLQTAAGIASRQRSPDSNALKSLSAFNWADGNEVSLLIDGNETFDAMFAAIDAATDYILIQFYLIRDDHIGRRLLERLKEARARDVAVYLLYDGIGSIALSSAYINDLKKAGASVSAFCGEQSWLRRLRLNFRNHRKIVIVDGHVGFLGGFNVGDEYLGKNGDYGAWRDTHLRIKGPGVTGLQHTFCSDWYFATQCLPDLCWHPESHKNDSSVLITTSSPVSRLDNCGLLFTQLIATAKKRLWIATPYFVPDQRVLSALQLAALRGVDVRILVPRTSDTFLLRHAPFAFFENAIIAGVKIYLYDKGFMHQKVVLVDDDYGVVGTANLDNRSFYLNFEAAAVVEDINFCHSLEQMLRHDLKACTTISRKKLASRNVGQRAAAQAAALFAPIL